ncbi:MAG: shikimate kinase [Lachnospiraceae bacterium]|nr:shikimate kinase [Lachnospiraceae bacterium]
MKLIENIYLIGFMGVGKSATQRALANMTGAPSVDTDELIEEKLGLTISDIFDKYGEDHFRKTETEVLKELTEKSPLIVSCGGGVVKKEENIEILKKGGKVFYLKADPKVILSRVEGRDTRPLLKGHMSVEGINELLLPRIPFYEKAKDFIVRTDDKTPSEVAADIIAILEKNAEN